MRRDTATQAALLCEWLVTGPAGSPARGERRWLKCYKPIILELDKQRSLTFLSGVPATHCLRLHRRLNGCVGEIFQLVGSQKKTCPLKYYT